MGQLHQFESDNFMVYTFEPDAEVKALCAQLEIPFTGMEVPHHLNPQLDHPLAFKVKNLSVSLSV